MAIQAILAETIAGWRALSADQACAWRTFAVGKTTTNGIGATVSATGRSAYTTVNSYRRIFTQAITATPPTILVSSQFVSINSVLEGGAALVILGSRSDSQITRTYVRVSKPLPSIAYQGKLSQLRTLSNDFVGSTNTPTNPDTWSLPLIYEQFTLAPNDRIAIGVQFLSEDYWPTQFHLERNRRVV